MGGIGKTLFGSGGDSASLSGNHAWDMIKNTYNPATKYTTMGGNAIGSLLGLGGGGGSSGGGSGKPGLGGGSSGGGSGMTDQGSALSNFANSGGMGFLLGEGTDAVNSNFYARGLGQSGAAMKGLEKYRSGLASTYLQQYMDNLFKFSDLGIKAGGVMTGAGAYSKGESDGAKGGILPTLVSAGSMIPGISDRRLKTNIVKLYTRDDGLNVYEYTLFGKRMKGVMADEVKTVKPEAYIPTYIGPFDGVDYGKIGTL
jgi:hypothetical protein